MAACRCRRRPGLEQFALLQTQPAGVKVRGDRPAQLDTSHAFTEHEWKLVRVLADNLA